MAEIAVPQAADVIIVGDGVIGLSVALEAARLGADVIVFGATRPGMATASSADLLAPSIGVLPPEARPFYFDSLERFPAFLAALDTGDAPLRTIDGIIELLSVGNGDSVDRIDAQRLADIEPALASAGGARFHQRGGAVDNVRLLRALRRTAQRTGLSICDDPIATLDLESDIARVTTASGERYSAATVVLAAGAWASGIAGLPRPLPVAPLKGQMLSITAAVLRHAVIAEGVYMVPRETETLVGATSENAGFDCSTSPEAVAALRDAAVRACPILASAPIVRSWAGIRPVTPDMLPILGRDPDRPALVYACGHSKNGILLAPATAVAIGALMTGQEPPVNIRPFVIERF